MRDIVQNKEYFMKCINYEKERINKFSQALTSVNAENKLGQNNAFTYLANFNKNLFKMSFSIGDSIEKIYYYYKEWIKYFSKVCTENDCFYDIIDVLSIAVFYEKRKAELAKYLITIINKLNLNDGILNLCLRYLGLDSKGNHESKLSYANNLLDDSENKAENIKGILENWYALHQDAYWYDTHKLKNNTYCGYWSFELGAISKILKLDDEELKGQPYYPYDLVHFNE